MVTSEETTEVLVGHLIEAAVNPGFGDVKASIEKGDDLLVDVTLRRMTFEIK